MSSDLPPLLYVEDEENDVFLVQIALERAGVRHPLELAANGPEALDYLARAVSARRLPALVLLDLNLPNMHGFEVLKRIRHSLELQTVPVLIFSSSDQESDRSRAAALGAVDYLVKPSNVDGFVEVARRLQEKWLMCKNETDA